MRKNSLLVMLLGAALTSFALSSCSHGHPEIIHLDFADDIYSPGPTMGEKAAGHFEIDTTIKNCELYFLVNERNPKYYPEPVIHRFIDTCKFIQDQIAKRYNELRIHFYHRSNNTEEMLDSRTTRALTLCYNDDISEYVWRDGHLSHTVFYDEHGRIISP